MSKHGVFWWNELVAKDVEASKAFYKQVIGWDYEVMPMPNGGSYSMAKVPGAEMPSGGMFQMPDEWGEMAPHWVAYICVESVDDAVAKAEAAGGKVLEKPFDVPGVGRIAVLADTDGVRIGVMTPANQG